MERDDHIIGPRPGSSTQSMPPGWERSDGANTEPPMVAGEHPEAVAHAEQPSPDPTPLTVAASLSDDAIPTRAQAQAARNQETVLGFKYELPYTGGFARVRLLSIADRATIDGLPKSIQDELQNELLKSSRNGKEVLSVRASIETQEKLANAFCVLGFIKPRLVLTEADVDPSDPYCWTVGDLHMEERTGYLLRCLNTEVRQARKLLPFHP